MRAQRTAADPRAAGPGLERPGRRARKRGPRLACAVGRSSSPPRSPARRNCRNHCVSETTEKSPLAGNCTEWRGVQARGQVCGSRRATPPVTAASALPPSCRERCLSDRIRLLARPRCLLARVPAGQRQDVRAPGGDWRGRLQDSEFLPAWPICRLQRRLKCGEVWTTARRTAWRKSRGCAGGPQGRGADAPTGGSGAGGFAVGGGRFCGLDGGDRLE